MPKTFNRRTVLTSAPALACAPALAAPSPDDPLVSLAAEYHRIHEEIYDVPDEVADQYSDHSHALTLKMLELIPTTAAGASALLGVVHYELREGLLWDQHPRLIEKVMTFLDHQ